MNPEDECDDDDDGIEEMEHSMWDRSEGIIELGTECEETEGNFDKEEGGDSEGYEGRRGPAIDALHSDAGAGLSTTE